jgi:hypothetical protein
MKILEEIVASLNKEEIRSIKLFMHRTGNNADRKDEMLLDQIRKLGERYDEEKVLQKLYGDGDKNALYRLKNRLMEDIGKSLIIHHSDSDDVSSIIQHLLLARIFRSKGAARVSFQLLNKAAKKASVNEYFDWLDIIYGEYIVLSQDTLLVNPEEFISKRKQNRTKLLQAQEIDDILAALIYRIRISQNFSRENMEILKILQKTVNDFSSSKLVRSSPVLRFKIYQSVSRILLQQQDYRSLEKYLRSTYREFEKEGLFNKTTHETKLQMLTYLINSLFKNRKYEESLEMTATLQKAMKEFGGVLYDKYLFYYYNSLVINYSVTDIDSAIEILHEARENKVIRRLPVYNVFIYMNLACLNFERKKFREALKNLVKPMLQDEFLSLDQAWHLKIGVFELMIRYELGDTDFISHRMMQLRKDHSQLLSQKEYSRQKAMLKLFERLCENEDIRKNKQLQDEIRQLLVKEVADSSTDNDIINYRDWLKSKIS